MKTVLMYDRCVLTKELNEKIKKVGDVFEIANIFEDSFLLRDGKTRTAIGVVSFEDFEKHFVHEENFKGWTDWIPMTGFDGQTDVFYKTNRRKVIVKFLTDKVRAESCCAKEDGFNLSYGVQLAYLRCLNKALAKKKAECEDKIEAITFEMSDNNNIMKRMIDSLES